VAYPGEVRKGDRVRWFDYHTLQEREGVVVRVARNGTWADVRSPHQPRRRRLFRDTTYLTRRVLVTSLRVALK